MFQLISSLANSMQLYLGIKYKKTEYDLYKESKQVVEDLKARLIKAKNSPNSSAALVATIRAELRDADGICDAHRRDVQETIESWPRRSSSDDSGGHRFRVQGLVGASPTPTGGSKPMTEGEQSSEFRGARRATWAVVAAIVAEIAANYFLKISLGIDLQVALAAVVGPTMAYAISRGLAKNKATLPEPSQERSGEDVFTRLANLPKK
jgi:hypothetical protein